MVAANANARNGLMLTPPMPMAARDGAVGPLGVGRVRRGVGSGEAGSGVVGWTERSEAHEDWQARGKGAHGLGASRLSPLLRLLSGARLILCGVALECQACQSNLQSIAGPGRDKQHKDQCHQGRKAA